MGDDKLRILRFLNRWLMEEGRRQTYDSPFLKSMKRWMKGRPQTYDSSFLKSMVGEMKDEGKRQTYDSSFLKSRERWRRGDDNLGFFDSSFLEFQETRELRVERQRRGNGRDIENTKTYSS